MNKKQASLLYSEKVIDLALTNYDSRNENFDCVFFLEDIKDGNQYPLDSYSQYKYLEEAKKIISYEEEKFPKSNEVWITKSKNLALVVSYYDQEGEHLGFIWWDKEERKFTFSKLENQLDTKTLYTPNEFFKH